jgi:hypothetical protein
MEMQNKFFAGLKSGLRALSPNCREAVRLQSETLDHELTRLQRFGLRVHLALCKWCRRYGQQLRFLRRAAHEHEDDLAQASPHSLSPEARERLKRALHDKGA